ncbi:MAG: serine kinase [Bacillota bacterium]|uniref:Serine kinase n=1 Tax=Thermanaerosceptrum fracticalcis TaxID=1712410 RepID=A0A7G6E672_THEFR|nr:hypothetical protein [Thermanaerosceptrum fracticalcis]QNB47576.1 serine kinase [Thermanaerosceptrum fracticalcis]
MKLGEIIEKLKLERLTSGEGNLAAEVRGCYIGDLLSNVMAHAQAGNVWLTVQIHPNIVAVASLLNLPAIILVEGHQPQPETLAKAKEEGIVLLSSEHTSYHLAGQMYMLGLGR